VFWDKLFGTFQSEEEKPVYGLTHPLKSHSFLWQHFHYYMELWVACRRAGNFRGILRVLFGKPEDIDQDIRPALERKLLPKKKMQRQHSFRFKAYLSIQLILSLVMLFGFTLYFSEFDAIASFFIVTFLLMTLVICGAMLEQRRWIFYLEVARCLSITGYLSFISGSLTPFLISLIFFFVIIRFGMVETIYFRAIYSSRE
jgi:hypothetical protein